MIARARGCGPCGVSILILSAIARAASPQLNRMILRITIALGGRPRSGRVGRKGAWRIGGALLPRSQANIAKSS